MYGLPQDQNVPKSLLQPAQCPPGMRYCLKPLWNFRLFIWLRVFSRQYTFTASHWTLEKRS